MCDTLGSSISLCRKDKRLRCPTEMETWGSSKTGVRNSDQMQLGKISVDSLVEFKQ